MRAQLPAQPEVLPATKEVSNPWDYEKDGKHYFGLVGKKKILPPWRVDPEKLMRK